MRAQKSAVDRSTPARYVWSPNVTASGTTRMPWAVATAASRSDAESVTKAMRATAPSRVAVSGADHTGPPDGVGNVRRDAATLKGHGSLALGRARRHVHAPLQHGAHGDDAGRLPVDAPRARRAVRRGDDAGLALRRVLHQRARPVADLRRPLGQLRPP